MEKDQKYHPVKFAVAGFGHIGRRHAEEIALHNNGVLAAIVETDPDAAGIAAKLYQVPVYATIDELTRSYQNIDIVNICTPNGLHISMASEALMAGRHVLVEKPMGLSKKDCDELTGLGKRMEKQVFCVLQNRYSPPSQIINRMVREERLGKIYRVSVNCYWNRDKRYYSEGSWRGTKNLDGGPLYTQFSHFIDLLYWNFGPVKNIEARFFNYNHDYLDGIEDTGVVYFEFEKGGSGSFMYSTALYQSNLESSITIIGEKGTIKAGGQYMEKIDFFNVEGMEMPDHGNAMPPNNYGDWQGSAANHAFVIDNVIRALNGESFEMASAQDAVASVDIIERIYKFRKF